MSEICVGDAQCSYVLPLENVDLNYLSKYVQNPRVEKKLLWSKKCLDGETEYYQVHIVKVENDGCYSEPANTYKCHICNVDVPTMYSKEHNESAQHETFKTIFEKVLERVSKQISINTINNNIDMNNDLYYCVPCSKVIKLENKYKHESSEYHCKSKEDIKVLNDFYKIFKDNRIDDDSNEENLNDDNDLKSNHSYGENIYDTKNNNLNACSTDNDDDIFKHSLLFAPTPITHNNTTNSESTHNHQNMKNQNQPSIIEESDKIEKIYSFEEYLREMLKKYKINVYLPRVDGEFIFIKAPNGDQVKVSREHFHSYRQVTNYFYCQMCKMYIPPDTKSHDVCEKHVRNIFKPINERYGRLIDTVSTHCIPCNEVVLTDSDHHTINDNHKKIMKNTITLSKTLCDACNVYIDSHNFSGHTDSKKHLKNIMHQNSIFAINNSENVTCKICNIYMSKHSVKAHINSSSHKNNKTKNNKPKNNTSSESTSPQSEFCEICKVNVPKCGMDTHIAGKPHQKMLNDLLNVVDDLNTSTAENGNSNAQSTGSSGNSTSSNEFSHVSSSSDDKIDSYYDLLQYIDDTKTKLRCKICNVNVPYLERNIIEHMEGRNHTETQKKKEKFEVYEKSLTYIVYNGKTDIKCKVCSVVITNNERKITEHMEGKTHLELANQQKMEAYKKLLFYTDDTKIQAKCEICDVNVPYVQQNIIEHMEGKNHMAVENEWLEYHKIVGEPTGYTCECCDIQITHYLDHINSYNHTIKYQYKYKIDKNEFIKYVYDNDANNSVARRYRELYRNLLRHNCIIKTSVNDTKYDCFLCDIKNLGRNSEINHVLGDRHRSRRAELNLFTGI